MYEDQGNVAPRLGITGAAYVSTNEGSVGTRTFIATWSLLILDKNLS